jgi:hypothetical protein
MTGEVLPPGARNLPPALWSKSTLARLGTAGEKKVLIQTNIKPEQGNIINWENMSEIEHIVSTVALLVDGKNHVIRKCKVIALASDGFRLEDNFCKCTRTVLLVSWYAL